MIKAIVCVDEKWAIHQASATTYSRRFEPNRCCSDAVCCGYVRVFVLYGRSRGRCRSLVAESHSATL